MGEQPTNAPPMAQYVNEALRPRKKARVRRGTPEYAQMRRELAKRQHERRRQEAAQREELLLAPMRELPAVPPDPPRLFLRRDLTEALSLHDDETVIVWLRRTAAYPTEEEQAWL